MYNKNNNFLSDKIKTLGSFLFSIQSDCNNNPFDTVKIERKLSKIKFDKNDLFLVEDLPGPLAKLFLNYKRHKNKSNIFEKFDFVEHFFIVLLFFNISIILGVFKSNYGFFLIQKDRIMKSMYNPESIGFGDLINLSKTLSKIIREKLGSKNGEDFLRALFKVSDIDFVKKISNVDIYKKIEEFSFIRNEIKGHGGRISNETYLEILPKVEKIFYDILDLLSYFSYISIILGTNFKKKLNCFLGEVTFVKGYAMPYLVEDYEISEILLDDSLYYIDNEVNIPIQLPGLIKHVLGKDEGEVSIYFYNRIEGNKLRYVNYDLLDGDKYYTKNDVNDLVLF